MQIHLSEYTIVEKTAQALDPLGLMQPANALRDALFPQFTVLTRHPAHLGLLCAVWQALDAEPVAKGTPMARRFRDAEVLWGVACAANGERPVNITKFQRLVDSGLPLSLPRISRQDAIFKRLSYGTLGHYSRPGVTWGLLRRGNEGLTPLGRRLGEGFSSRAVDGGLRPLLDQWRRGQPFDGDALLRVAATFGLGAAASKLERDAWREAIGQHVAAAPGRRVLWEDPLDAAVLDAVDDRPASWRAVWQQAMDRYPSLQPILRRVDLFERLTAGLQFLFDWRLAQAEFSGEAANFKVREDLAGALSSLAREYVALPGDHASVPLIARAAEASPKLDALAHGVLEHHMAHHRKKQVRPFLTHDGIQVRGRTDRQQLGKVLGELAKAPDVGSALDALQLHYRRDWHFAKCRLWKRHADGLGWNA